MEEFYKAIKDKIKASGYPGEEVNGEDIYNDICDQMEEKKMEPTYFSPTKTMASYLNTR